jgi:hypothetical protein
MSVESVLISHATASGGNPKPHSRRGVHRHWKRQAAACRKLVVVCAWCANPAAEPSGQASHGMCPRCFDRLSGGAK